MILHSKIIGEGTPFMILHGFLGSGDNWKTLGNQFAENGYQVHLVDQRNHGRSFHNDIMSYTVMVEDLLRYAEHHQLSEFILMGHSMGGKTAMQFAVDHPEKVQKLLVADIAPKAYPQHHQDILKGLSSLDFSTLKSRGAADTALAEYVNDVGTRQFLLKNLYWKEKGVLGLRMNLRVLTQQIDAVGEALATNSIFKKDTLFLRGSKSGYIDEIDEIHIKKYFPKAKIVTISNAGHWLHAENPSEFYQNVMKFL